MYAHIYAESRENYHKGKTTFVYIDPLNWKVTIADGALSLSGHYRHEASPGTRGGVEKIIDRTLQIDLTSDDIRALVAAALDNGLLARADLRGLRLRAQLREQTERADLMASELAELGGELVRLRTVIDDCRAALESASKPPDRRVLRRRRALT